MTSVAKKVGGPGNFVALIVSASLFIGGSAALGIKKIKKRIDLNEDNKKREALSAVIFTVHTDGCSNEGLNFHTGDKFRVLETTGDVTLIELIGNNKNPYIVSGELLSSISSYKNIEKE